MTIELTISCSISHDGEHQLNFGSSICLRTRCVAMRCSGSVDIQDKTQVIVWETGKTRATYVFVNFFFLFLCLYSSVVGVISFSVCRSCAIKSEKSCEIREWKSDSKRKWKAKRERERNTHLKFSSVLIRFRCVWLIKAKMEKYLRCVL